MATALAVSLSVALGDFKIQDLKRLAADASRETWSFDAVASTESHELILQCHGSGVPGQREGLNESRLFWHAFDGGVSVPEIVASDTTGENAIGVPLMVSRRIRGDSIPREILRDDSFAGARRCLVADFGRELAAIHRLELDASDQIPVIYGPLTVGGL